MTLLARLWLLITLFVAGCPTSFAQIPGYALHFDGVDDYVTVPDHVSYDFSVSRVLTAECWVKIDTTPLPEGQILGKWGPGGDEDDEWALTVRLTGLEFVVNSSTNPGSPNSSVVTTSGQVPRGQWIHIACVWNGNLQLQQLFVNGVLVQENNSAVSTIPATSTAFRIGYNGAGGVYKGNIDEVRVWSIGRTQTEIQQTMNHTLTGSEFGLVGYWRFDEGSGTTANDLSILGNHGTLVNDPTWAQVISSQFTGYALGFDGIDDYVDLPESPSLTTDFTYYITLEAWVYSDSFQAASVIASGNQNDYALAVLSDGRLRVDMYGLDAGIGAFFSRSTLAPNTWFHIAVTYDSLQETILINGIEDTSRLASGIIASSPQSEDLRIGSYSGGTPNFFTGIIDEVRIWNAARSPAQIQQSMNDTLSGTETGLVGYWRFDEGSGTTTNDLTSHGNHGTLENGPMWIGSAVKWITTVHVNDNCGAGPALLVMGQAIGATDDIDATLGETNLPPVPPSGAFDARFTLPVIPPRSSLKDYRNDSLRIITWRMTFQPSSCGYPMTFTWDSSALPSEKFRLKDEFGGTVADVDMRQAGSYTLTNPAITSLLIEYVYTECNSLGVMDGWNMVSVPLAAPAMGASTLFPNAVSSAYKFSGDSGYVVRTTLEPGTGYWLKFPAGDSATVCGTPVGTREIPVLAGWNMIGPFEESVTFSAIQSDPPGILEPNAFGYGSGGYFIAPILQPGRGYWISTTDEGTLYLSGSTLRGVPASRDAGTDLITLRITDATGSVSSVYFAAAGSSRVAGPPPAPEGILDARFVANTLVEPLDAGTLIVRLKSPVYPVTVALLGAGAVSLMINSEILEEGRPVTLSDGSGLFSVASDGNQSLPTAFVLHQNHPNPFNPTTTIRFDVPVASQVTLKVFDILGREVVTLVDEPLEVGRHSAEWSVANAASGVYLYRLQSGGFSETRKMVVVR